MNAPRVLLLDMPDLPISAGLVAGAGRGLGNRAEALDAGTFDSHMVDCPFPFFHEGRCHMTYVGRDGIGYRSGSAVSDDLLEWRKEGPILDQREKGAPTEYNAAITCIQRDNELFGPGTLKF